MRRRQEYGYGMGINIAIAATVLVVGYVITKKLGFFKAAAEGDEMKLLPNSTPVRSTFSPANEVSKLAELFSYITDLDGQDNRAFKAILAYNDNELIAVHNLWRKQYAGGGGNFSGIKSTLRKQVESETILSWARWDDAAENKKKVIARLDRLGL